MGLVVGLVPSCGYRSLDRRVKSENNWLGSPIQLCVQGSAKGVERVPSLFCTRTPVMNTTTPPTSGRQLDSFLSLWLPHVGGLSGCWNTSWVKRLPSVVAALDGEVTRLTGRKSSDAIKAKTLTQKPLSVVPGRPLGLKEQKIPSESAFATFTSPVNWSVVAGGPLTQCGLLKCTGWDAR